ncbi:MAG: DUF86 domain-containing protein [Chitinophagales bacterium]|nr:DUF86 domain-containing protein [Chitinophagales bacterium]
MKGKLSDEIRLLHILEAINFIEKFSMGRLKEDLDKDFMYRFSVERQLEIIGEATNNLSDSVKLNHPDVPWPQIISFRNFIVHEYFGLDLELVWSVIEKHLPEFKAQIQSILKDFEKK